MRKTVSRATCGTPFYAITAARRATVMALSNHFKEGRGQKVGSPSVPRSLPFAFFKNRLVDVPNRIGGLDIPMYFAVTDL